MRSAANLTPLSHRLIENALSYTHRRYFAAADVPFSAARPGLLWDEQALAGAIAAGWDQPAARIAHLLGVAPPAVAAAGKPDKALNESAALLAAQPHEQSRLRSWHDQVMAMEWSQAQLLQVMEEIELYINDAIANERRLAAAASGCYAHLFQQLQARLGGDASAVLLDLVSGLPTPQAALVAALAAGKGAEELRRQYGHLAATPLELAQPRFGEAWPFAATTLGAGAAWAPAQAAARRQTAGDKALAAAGLLQRPAWRRLIAHTQALFQAQAAAQEGLTLALAATRRWCLAAAQEGRRNDRIDEAPQIFLLELEEIKQMMTGEWHSRAQVQPRIRARAAAAAAAETPPLTGLGLSGGSVTAPAQVLAAPAQIKDLPDGAIACIPALDLAWAELYLRAGGVIVADGDLFSPVAMLGRSGGVPTLIGDPGQPLPPADGLFHLDPAQFPP